MTLKVTICIPTYNSAGFLERTLQTIAEQSFRNFECILVDNKSTDNTVEIAKKFLDKIPNFQIVVNDENIGSENNFNKCLKLGAGEYLAIYHSDDLYHQDIISKSVSFLNENSDAGAVSTLGIQIDQYDNYSGVNYTLPRSIKKHNTDSYTFEQIFKALLRKGGNSFLLCPTVMFKRTTLNDGFHFEYSKYKSSSDLGLWLSISKKYKFGILNDNFLKYRIHENQGSQTLIRENTSFPDEYRVIKDFYSKIEHKNDYKKLFEAFMVRLFIILAVKRSYSGKKTYVNWLLRSSLLLSRSSLLVSPRLFVASYVIAFSNLVEKVFKVSTLKNQVTKFVISRS